MLYHGRFILYTKFGVPSAQYHLTLLLCIMLCLLPLDRRGWAIPKRPWNLWRSRWAKQGGTRGFIRLICLSKTLLGRPELKHVTCQCRSPQLIVHLPNNTILLIVPILNSLGADTIAATITIAAAIYHCCCYHFYCHCPLQTLQHLQPPPLPVVEHGSSDVWRYCNSI